MSLGDCNIAVNIEITTTCKQCGATYDVTKEHKCEEVTK